MCFLCIPDIGEKMVCFSVAMDGKNTGRLYIVESGRISGAIIFVGNSGSVVRDCFSDPRGIVPDS